MPIMTSRFQELDPLQPQTLAADAQRDASVHCWSAQEIDALTLADVVKRPLLVRGEPGTGKTQLARAAAHHLGWALHAETIHPRYEAQDLVYRFDAIRRLADAQAGRELDDSEYFEPGPLWKAFGWDSATGYGSCRGQARAVGHVILIDEIDKADSDLPNSLLEALGQRSLWIAPLARPIGGPGVAAPLIVITTNEERELPPAFLRRCVVLNLAPDPTMTYLRWLVERGRAHFGPVASDAGSPSLLTEAVLWRAAAQLVADRQAARDAGLAPPGPAEYLDLLQALCKLAPGAEALQLAWLDRLSQYAFVKLGDREDQPALSQHRPPLPGPAAPGA